MKQFALLLLALAALPAYALKTQSVEHTGFTEFASGQTSNSTLDSQGILRLGYELKELVTLDEPVIWNGVVDSQGRLIIGTGNKGKVFRIDPDAEEQEPELLFDPGDVIARALAMDADGNLYIGTSPNGRIYRIAEGGRPEIFFAPEEEYIWDMLFSEDGSLYVATGSSGKIYKLPPNFSSDDEAEVFYKTGQTHVTRLKLSSEGNLLAGTAPTASLYEISAKDEGRVLYNAAADEVSGIHYDGDGNLLFSVFSEKDDSDGDRTPLDLPGILARYQSDLDEPIDDANADEQEPPALPSFIYKIGTDGFVEPWWTPGSKRIHSLYVGEDGSLLVGTDDEGKIYSVGNRSDWLLAAQTDSGGSITSLIPAEDGLFVLTSNPASVYLLTNEKAQKGSFESTVIDTRQVARWGNLVAIAEVPGSEEGIRLETRSGNSKDTSENWSTWQPLDGQSIQSPQARYLQYRAIFENTENGLRSVRVFYQHKNFAPIIDRVNIVPVQIQLVNVPTTRKPNIGLSTLLEGGENVQATTEEIIRRRFRVLSGEGYVTAGWKAFDPNGDRLLYHVDIRGDGEMRWVRLAKDIDVPAYSFNTKGFEDGYYEIRVTAVDSLSNPPETEREGESMSDPFLLDNTAPSVQMLPPVINGNSAQLSFAIADDFSIIQSAEYVIDGAQKRMAIPEDHLYDSNQEKVLINLEDLEAGQHSILLTALDEAGNESALKRVFVVPEE